MYGLTECLINEMKNERVKKNHQIVFLLKGLLGSSEESLKGKLQKIY